jgi:subtilisin family serine protease
VYSLGLGSGTGFCRAAAKHADHGYTNALERFDVYGSNEVAALRVAVNRAITYAYRKGATTIVSAGNDGLDLNAPDTASLVNFNGYASHAISIAAVAPIGWAKDPGNIDLNQPTGYSNSGPEIDFAAPGGNFVYPGNEVCVVAGLARPCWVFDYVFSTGNGGWYWSVGTSMAAPHAAGVAALIIGENGGQMQPAQVKKEMRRRAIDLGKAGGDDIYGYGVATSGY